MAFLDLISQDWGWRTIAVLAAAGSVLVSVALIMLARLFDMKSLEQSAKTEFVYAASTVFIVLFSVGIIGFGDTVLTKITAEMYINTITACPADQAAIPGTPCYQLQHTTFRLNVDTMPDMMMLYMDAPAKCSQQFLDYMYYAAIPIDACASVYMEIFMSEQLTCFGLKWASERITNGVQILTFYMFAYYLIGHAMMFVKYYAGFFFALGVALRAFPPSRGGGAYLMALSIGLYFVLPFTYVLITTMSLSSAQSSFLTATGVTQTASGTTIQYACNTPAVGDLSGLGCGTGSLAKQGELMGWLQASKTNITDFFSFQLPELTKHLASVMCIFPLIAFTIFFTFVLNTTSLFGGNIPEIGRGLVRLI